ncbi:MAG TPA: TonB family protein [Flavobacterium sp.]|nr:TonB family protein [Flavobacterium sp.]
MGPKKYVAHNFRVPENEGLKGKVFISFVIGEDGETSDVKIIKSMGAEVDREAIRVVSECPPWNSGMLRGVKISVLYSLPINIQSGN